MPYFNAYTRVKGFLKAMMMSIMKQIQEHPDEPVHPLFEEMGMGSIAKDLQHQIDTYWRGEYPFKQLSSCNDPMVWWQERAKLSDARTLAVSTYST
jgi:hypothetical protein